MKQKAILVGLVLLMLSFMSLVVEAEIHEYAPNTVTCTLGVCVGTVNEVASLDVIYYQVTEEDVGADDTDFATEEWMVWGTLDSGAFPACMQVLGGAHCVYEEEDDDLGALTGDNFFLIPTGVGTYTRWNPQPVVPNWQNVDDDPPHDVNATYVSQAVGAGRTETYAMEDVGAMPVGEKESGTVTVFAWGLSNPAAAEVINNTVITYATLYDEAVLEPLMPGYTNHTWVMGANPNTGNEWTVAEINAMEVGMWANALIETRVTSVGAVVPTQALNYVLDIRHNVTGVPAGRENYLLTMRARDLVENAAIYVYDHVAPGWDLMFAIDTGVWAIETFTLTEADHVNAGEVWVRSVDSGGDPVGGDQLDIDLLTVRAWDVSYTLEVQFDWVGLQSTGKSSRLSVHGYRSAGETMTLEVMRVGGWQVLDATVLDVAPAVSYNYDLAPADIIAGGLQIRFTDNVPTDNGPADVIYLDFISLSLEEENGGHAAPIDVYLDISYDMWDNEIIVKVWWVQTGGAQPAVELGRWVTLWTDGQLLDTYEVEEGGVRVEAPWPYLDQGSHNITGVGAVNVHWEWIQSSQTYFSEPEQEYVTNFPRIAVIILLICVVLAAILAVAIRWARGRRDVED